jgi:uncharacterized protein (TIGR03437 family)
MSGPAGVWWVNCRVALLLLFAAPASAQVFTIGSPKPALICGESMTLTPVLRDPSGNQLNVSDWIWTSLDPSILSVDGSGKVTGRALGVGRIQLRSASQPGDLFGALQLQVQPNSLSITPAAATVVTGGSQQFKASATDINGNLIPNVSFSWIVTLESGRSELLPSTTAVDSSGSFHSSAAGHYTVHAVIDYLPIVQGFPSHFEATAGVDVIVPASFGLDRLITSDPVIARKLQPAPGVFAASEAGPIAFTASTDGLSTAVIKLDGAAATSIISTGSPSPQAGNVVAGFQSVAMNARGDMLVSIKRGDNASGALLASSAAGNQFVLLDNATGTLLDGTPVYELSYFSLTPYCLNDNGDAVIKALYRPQDGTSSDYRDGLFLLPGALSPRVVPVLLWSAAQAVPSVPLSGGRITFAFDNTEQVPGWSSFKGLGIDNRGVVYFVAQAGSARGLFQVTSGAPQTPQKILAVGDSFLGSTVKTIEDLVVNANGDVAARVDLNNGDPHIVLFRLGKYVSDLLTKGGNPRVLAINTGGIVFTGIPGSGKPDGLYLWDYKTVNTVLSLGASVTRISTAALNSKGRITAVVQNASNSFVITQAGGGNLVASGADISLPAAIDVKRLVKGSRTGLPSVAVSDPGSLFDLDGAGHIVARATLGLSLAANTVFEGSDNFVEDGAGAQYFVTSNGLYKSFGGAVTPLLASGTKASDGVVLTPRLAMGASASGIVLVDCNTNAADGHRRLYKVRNGLTLVTRTKTVFNGRQIVDWTDAAVDNGSNVAVILAEDDGAQDLTVWTGTTGKSILTTRAGSLFQGEQVVAIDRLRSAPSAFYVRYALTANFFHAAVAKFTSSGAQKIVASGETLPDGTVMGDLRISDGNARGDVVFSTTALITGTQVLAARLADGSTRIVAANNRPLTTGDYLTRFSDANIRDDGTVYFLGYDVNDRAIVYRASFTDSGPLISTNGIANAADFRADTISPGSWISIYGLNFGSAGAWADVTTTSVGGASVTVCGATAVVSFNSGPVTSGASVIWQINALVPDSAAPQTSCTVVVSVNGKVSAAVTIAIQSAALGIFSFVSAGGNTLPLITHLDYTLVGPSSDGFKPAKPGEAVTAWGTGNCSNPVVTVGGATAEVQFAGRVVAGVCQINFKVPADASGTPGLKFSTSSGQYNLWLN